VEPIGPRIHHTAEDFVRMMLKLKLSSFVSSIKTHSFHQTKIKTMKFSIAVAAILTVSVTAFAPAPVSFSRKHETVSHFQRIGFVNAIVFIKKTLNLISIFELY
jgi:hypothetical protein